MVLKKRRIAYKRSNRNKTGILLISLVVILLVSFVGVRSLKLIKQQKEYDAKIAYYEQLYAQEQKRSEELDEFEKYTQTTMYIEEVAKNKFGLVHDGEIVFIAEK